MKLSFSDVIPSRLKFNSHLKHNPECDILELVISRDAFITYCINIKTGEESMGYYSGANYVVNSSEYSHSRHYTKDQIPKKYISVWNALKYYYETKILFNKRTAAEIYLEYVNDWITSSAMANNYGRTEKEMNDLIEKGRIEHENNVTMLNAPIKVN